MCELVETGAHEFATPLGAVRITGPQGSVPFSVARLAAPDFAAPLEHYYELRVPLESLAVGVRYAVSIDGAELRFNDSDEFGVLYTVTSGGITLGITAFNLSEQCHDALEGSSWAVPKGYDVEWCYSSLNEFAIVRCGAQGDMRDAFVLVAWLPSEVGVEKAEDAIFLTLMWSRPRQEPTSHPNATPSRRCARCGAPPRSGRCPA